MNIELTKGQYEKLVEMVYLGNWIINSIRAPDDIIKEYEEAEQFFYSHSKKFGTSKQIKFDEGTGEYDPTNFLEDSMQSFLDEYEDDAFWDSLIEKLSDIEIYNNKINPSLEEIFKIREKYETEFVNNGLARVRLDWTGNRTSQEE